jgi:hypothetical protein
MSHDNSRIHFLHQCTESILRSLKAPMSPRTRLADCVPNSGGGYSRKCRLGRSKEALVKLTGV